jgi:hypothetical protein
MRREHAAFTAASMRRDAKRRLGQMRAVVASRGIELEGSPLMLLSQNADELEMEAAAVERQAAQAASLLSRRARDIQIGGVLDVAGQSFSFGAGAAQSAEGV